MTFCDDYCIIYNTKFCVELHEYHANLTSGGLGCVLPWHQWKNNHSLTSHWVHGVVHNGLTKIGEEAETEVPKTGRSRGRGRSQGEGPHVSNWTFLWYLGRDKLKYFVVPLDETFIDLKDKLWADLSLDEEQNPTHNPWSRAQS